MAERIYDVIVVGGGTAGWVAALAAARQKKDVLLVERKGYLGGVLASGLPINGFFDASQRQVVKGYADELVVRLQEFSGGTDYRLTDLWFGGQVFVDPAVVKPALIEMCHEAGVEILMFSQVVDVVLEGNRVGSIVVQSKSSQEVLRGRSFVDASGDAALSHLAGAPLQEMKRLQPPTLVFRLENVDLEALREHLVAHPEDFMQGRMLPGRQMTREFFETTDMFFVFPDLVEKIGIKGEYAPFIDRFMFTATPGGSGVVVNMLRALGIDGSSSRSLSQATVDLYRNLIPLVDFYRKNIPGFQHCVLCDAEPEIQLRETRRIAGDYTITAEDALGGESFDDNIAVAGYFIDIHSSEHSHGTWKLLEKPFGIPYRSLLPQNLEGVVTAGRCISGSEEAAASYRVMATCMAVGQAAGTAAALSADGDTTPREIDVEQLRRVLKREGAIL